MTDDPYRTTPAYQPQGPLARPQRPGELSQLAQYRIVKPLGHGGMGQVYEAEDLQLRRPVALKVMRPDLATEDSARARFLQEARAAAALKHDHIVTIYQVGEDQGVPFLAMELLKGKSLDEWLRPDRRASTAETVMIGKQILKGLEAAHAAGLIHRDIKPANLWLEAPRGRVKILDFGLARLRAMGSNPLTEDGAVLGTPAFMAPEQARGEAVDQRSDLFSFGCVLYRMVTGRLPFQGKNYTAVLTALALETPTPVRQINPEVPPRLAALLERLLAKKADDRPASAKGVLAEWHEIEKDVKPGPAPQIADKAANAAPAITQAPDRRRVLYRLFAVAGLGTAAAVALVVHRGNRQDKDVAPGEMMTAPADAVSPTPVSVVDLLELVNIERDVVKGRWTRTPGAVKGMTRPAEDRAYLILPWDPPESYQLRVTVTRLKADAGAALIGLASGELLTVLTLDIPFRQSFASGILSSGKRFEDRDRLWKGRILPLGRPVLVTCTVEPGKIRVVANNVAIFSEEDLSALRPRSSEAPTAPLFVGAHNNGYYEFQDIVLEPLGDDAGGPLKRE